MCRWVLNGLATCYPVLSSALNPIRVLACVSCTCCCCACGCGEQSMEDKAHTLANWVIISNCFRLEQLNRMESEVRAPRPRAT